jgi:HPt (histidine-containing phosphotransfer) domain-containing protein
VSLRTEHTPLKLSQAEIEARLAEVRRSYIISLAEKREAVTSQWAALRAQWHAPTYQSLYLIIHSLAGSAETFGLSEISRHARSVIDLFKQHPEQCAVDVHCVPEISAGIDRLITSMASALRELNER